MASLNEQTEKSLYEKLQLPEFRSKEEIKEGLQSLAVGPVTGTLGLPSDILDLANLANDLSADYTGNILAKGIFCSNRRLPICGVLGNLTLAIIYFF